MPWVDYYELLGVSRGASTADIKSAYRTLAKVMHPDAGGTDGTFRMLREAYETLSDPARRAAYDRPDQPAPAGTVIRPAAGRSPATRAKARARARPAGSRSERLRGFGGDPDFVPTLPRLDPDSIPWWPTVDAGERVRYAPSTRPRRGHTLAALGGWLPLLVPLLLPGPLPPLLLILWLPVLAAAVLLLIWLARRHLAASRVDRAFVAEYGVRTVFGRPGHDGDQLAERLTAQLLSIYLARLPGARIFHGLAWPGSVFADVDHAVLCGRRLVLIESKMWLPGHYAADDTGTLWRNGHPFRGGAIRLPEGVGAFRDLLPEVEVRGALVIYPSRAGEVTTGEPPDVPAPPMSPEQLVWEIGEWLAGEPAVVDREIFRTVLGQVVVS